MTRKRNYKHIAKLRRRVRGREKLILIEHRATNRRPLPKPHRRVVAPYLEDAEGNKLSDAVGKRELLTDYFLSVWRDRESGRSVPDWVWQRWNAEVLNQYPELTGALLRNLVLKMGKGRT